LNPELLFLNPKP